ncbi:MAG: Pr6Pr family membrane protein [Bryobacteraceae bacterium]
MHSHTLARIFAAGIAASAWVGLAVQLSFSYATTGSLWLAAWAMLGFFTILTNLLVAVVFTSIALDRMPSPGALAGTMLSILLVGIINALLLWGALELSGGSALVDKLLHVATPILVPIYWACFTPKGQLTRKYPLIWSIYPLVYLAYAMLRGLATGRFAYPFINALELGWQRTAINVFLISLGFLAAGYAVVRLDAFLSSRAVRSGA